MTFIARLQLQATQSESPDHFRQDVLAGLSAPQKSIPPKYLYDAAGSALFDRICELPEYYLTRNEMAILRRNIGSIVAAIADRTHLVEFGSGSSIKTRLLLDHHCFDLYTPIDVSVEHLGQACEALSLRYPRLRIEPVVADYSTLATLPIADIADRTVGFFPGSTIGNLVPQDAVAFLRNARRLLGGDGALLLGVDTAKDSSILVPAYDDAAGVTAAFSLNLLRRINRELDGTFDLARFRHVAIHNVDQHRMELYLESLVPQIVTVSGIAFRFAGGERIHTEYSYKYPRERFLALASEAGYHAPSSWTDAAHSFDVHLLKAL